MIRRIEYYRPDSLSEALALLEKYGEDLKVLAGGTNLLVQLKEKTIHPKVIMDIKNIPGLSSLKINDKGEGCIGPLATMRAIEHWCSSYGRYNSLRSAAQQLGSPVIGNRATVGGNLCDGSPAADTAIVLLSYDTKLVLNELGKERTVALGDFFLCPHRVDLNPYEILSQITIPQLPVSTGEAFYKLGRRKALHIALVGVAVSITRDVVSPQKIKNVRIALSSVAPTPMRAKKAEGVLAGQEWNEDLLEEAGRLAADAASPITDIRATKEYRRAMIPVLVRRALNEAWNNTEKKSGETKE